MSGSIEYNFSGLQALVCHDNRLFCGMARLYEVFSKPFSLDIRVYTKIPTAEEWLSDFQLSADTTVLTT